MRTKGQLESRKQEDRLAKVLVGKRNAGSGAFWSRKGDVRSDLYLVEAKWTSKASMSIKASDLEKIVNEAVLDGRIPVFAFQLMGVSYITLLEDDFLELSHSSKETSCQKDTRTKLTE